MCWINRDEAMQITDEGLRIKYRNDLDEVFRKILIAARNGDSSVDISNEVKGDWDKKRLIIRVLHEKKFTTMGDHHRVKEENLYVEWY